MSTFAASTFFLLRPLFFCRVHSRLTVTLFCSQGKYIIHRSHAFTDKARNLGFRLYAKYDVKPPILIEKATVNTLKKKCRHIDKNKLNIQQNIPIVIPEGLYSQQTKQTQDKGQRFDRRSSTGKKNWKWQQNNDLALNPDSCAHDVL